VKTTGIKTRFLVLFFCVGLVVLFMMLMTPWFAGFVENNALIVIGFIYLGFTYFVCDTISLLYSFYEVDYLPWQRFVPYINEFYLLDMKFRSTALVLFFLMCGGFVVSFLPYNIRAIFGDDFALDSGFYGFIAAALFFILQQVVIGVGMISLMRTIDREAERLLGYAQNKLGVLAYACAFLPFLRFYPVMMARNPIDTLVTFRRQSVSSTVQSVRFVDEDDEEENN